MANNTDIKNILQALRKERKAQGKTQTEVAKEIGITQTYLSQLETGMRLKFSTAILLRYANALGKPITLIMWEACTEDDVPEEKREIFRSLKPSIDELIKTVFK